MKTVKIYSLPDGGRAGGGTYWVAGYWIADPETLRIRGMRLPSTLSRPGQVAVSTNDTRGSAQPDTQLATVQARFNGSGGQNMLRLRRPGQQPPREVSPETSGRGRKPDGTARPELRGVLRRDPGHNKRAGDDRRDGFQIQAA